MSRLPCGRGRLRFAGACGSAPGRDLRGWCATDARRRGARLADIGASSASASCSPGVNSGCSSAATVAFGGRGVTLGGDFVGASAEWSTAGADRSLDRRRGEMAGGAFFCAAGSEAPASVAAVADPEPFRYDARIVVRNFGFCTGDGGAWVGGRAGEDGDGISKAGLMVADLVTGALSAAGSSSAPACSSGSVSASGCTFAAFSASMVV